MFNRFKKKKDENLIVSGTTEMNIIPIPLATIAKIQSVANLNERIKRAEEAIFNEACGFIHERIEKGYLYTFFDAFAPVYRIDEKLDKNSITVAMNDCINHLSTFGYTAKIVSDRNLEISWQHPKEITLNDIEWSV